MICKVRNDTESFLPRNDYTFKKDVAKANWMITKLCDDGQIVDARNVFDNMPERDVISWTALISGYIKLGMIDKAREVFDGVNVMKNVVTWTVMLSGYVKAKRILEAEKLFDDMPEKNVVAWNTMIEGYVRFYETEKALSLFERMEERNVVSWNTLISGLLSCGKVEKARELFEQMPVRTVVSWTIMISGLARNKMVDEARLLFDRMPEPDVVSHNAMITGYAQNLRLAEACALFETMPEKDVKSWNTMITGFLQSKDFIRARLFFDTMPRKDIVSWTVMINGLMRDGKSEEALAMFVAMKRDSPVKPNEGTFASVLGACSALGEVMQIHQVISKTIYQKNEFVTASLLSMYSKCGDLTMARQMFDDVLKGHSDLVSWNSMIAAYAHHGCGREAIELFKTMQTMSTSLKPNDVTYLGLLSACSHAGLVQEGLHFFESLVKDKSLQVRKDHFTCVVDLYGRAGRLKEAFDLVGRLPFEASVNVWGALLLGCNIHGNMELGQMVTEKLLELDQESFAYLSEMKERDKVKMKKRGVKKQPGCSWIEVGNRFHVFVVGNRFGEESEAMHSLLFNLHEEMRMIGCTARWNRFLGDVLSVV